MIKMKSALLFIRTAKKNNSRKPKSVKQQSFITCQHIRSNSVKSSLPSCLQAFSPSFKSNDHSSRSEASQIGCPTVGPLGKEDRAAHPERAVFILMRGVGVFRTETSACLRGNCLVFISGGDLNCSIISESAF